MLAPSCGYSSQATSTGNQQRSVDATRKANYAKHTTRIPKERIIAELKTYIGNNGTSYREWYVGITADPEKRLFSDHGVSQQTGNWIYCLATSDSAARDAEDHFTNILGTYGGPGGGDSSSTAVYAYKITVSTIERT